MTRRALFTLAAASALNAATDEDKPPPVSEERWNDFAGKGNYYAAQLQRSIIDIKAWRWVLKAWTALR